jgi:succinate dehydrogenase flavin-adding protein (antitoxin of CptAB toxin-antitoxin module)
LGLTVVLSDEEVTYLRKIVDIDEERLARWFEKASKPSAVKDINDRMALLQSVRKKLW